MTAEERAEIVVTARLLRAASQLHWLAAGLTVVSAAALVMGAGNSAAAVAAIVCGIVANLYAFRIAFDAYLFEDIAANTLSTDGLDHALAALGKALTPGRPWPIRCRGARRLIVRAAIATAAQLIAIIAAGLS
jgi:hypothetical protein